MLWKCRIQYASKFGQLRSGHWTRKGQFSFQSKRKAMPKNVQTTTQLHAPQHASKVTLKTLQTRLYQYVNRELPDVQAGFRKGRGTRDQIADNCWINKAEVDVFLEFSYQRMLAIWSLVPLPFLNPAWTSRISLFTYCWSLTWRILSITLLVWDECYCAVVWTFFGIAFLRDWNENWPFPVLWPLLSFPNLLANWVHHFNSIIL